MLFYATVLPEEINYHGDADGLIELLIERGFGERTARQVVLRLQKRRVLVLPGMFHGYVQNEP